MQLRYENHIDVEPPGQWSTVSVPHARQPNGDSCGVLVMKIAENFLSGRSVLFSMTRADLINFRKRLGAFLIFQTGATNINTILMQDSVEDGATSVQDGATSVQDGATSVEDGATSVENGATSVEDGATQSTEQSKESAHKPALKMRKCKRKKIDTEKPESPEQASYTMRSSRKKKRPSSFIFPDITAGKHTYCVCQKKNDGELYWQCCVCLRWYHPMCIGRNEHEEPEFFKCNNCEMEDGRCQKKPKITSIHAVIHCEELDDLEAAIMAHLTAILGCKREMCKELSHQRHHEFESKPFQVLDRERRFHCFGTDIFIDKTIESITTDIKNSLMYTYTDPKHPYTGFPTRKFKPVNDESELGKVFSQNKLIADNYLLYVALKEALIFIVCVKKHCTYAESEKLCTESEVDVANLLKKKPVK
ncbi:uncharacterized protein LOC143057926 [Mytilus galloprovincialis]|uniref:uncharacterized protein LOC143057926 n=1 Tax=Mytilus galloprovincialis TaxID=29158 RepID=UPI003F7B66A4